MRPGSRSQINLGCWPMTQPYYEHAGITIYHGDCREVLPSLEVCDLVLTDPPYGIGQTYGGYVDSRENLKLLVDSTLPLILDSCKRALLTCGVANIHLYPEPKWTLCWFISGAGGVGPWGFTTWQPILAYGPDPYLENGMGCRPDAFWLTETSSPNGHPCPKPIGAWKWILRRGSALD